MPSPFLLTRVVLDFGQAGEDICNNLSAVTRTPDGSLWVGADEGQTLERLSPLAPLVYGEHLSLPLGEWLPLYDPDCEIDIEGLDYADGYLWLTGSHSLKRKKPKGKNAKKDLDRLGSIVNEPNRYLLARAPVHAGQLGTHHPHPDRPDEELRAAALRKTADGNALTQALLDDPHLGSYLRLPIPSKENGFDVESLAVRGERLWLGLRGPVLGQWAVILEVELGETEAGILDLRPLGETGRLYRKHFVHLNGLGVRDLCWQGDDLIILAGPTMSLEGEMRLYRLKGLLEVKGDALSSPDTGDLEVLFDLPFTVGSDHAEGLCLHPALDQEAALLVVYDAPDPDRRSGDQTVYADVFRIPA